MLAEPEIAADRLEWHDAGVDTVWNDESTQTMTWEVEVFRWDVHQQGDAQSGLLTFQGVSSVCALHDLTSDQVQGVVSWEVLSAKFIRGPERLECTFLFNLRETPGAVAGPGYAELTVICQEAWFIPAVEFLHLSPMETNTGR